MKAIMKFAVAFAVVATISFTSCSNNGSGSASGEGSGSASASAENENSDEIADEEATELTPVESVLEYLKSTNARLEAATSLEELEGLSYAFTREFERKAKALSEEDRDALFALPEYSELAVKFDETFNKKVGEFGGFADDEFDFADDEYYDGGDAIEEVAAETEEVLAN